jgi:hypothetical protein
MMNCFPLCFIFAFKFNLRRYSEAVYEAAMAVERSKESGTSKVYGCLVGRCRLTVSKPELKLRLVSGLETIM